MVFWLVLSLMLDSLVVCLTATPPRALSLLRYLFKTPLGHRSPLPLVSHLCRCVFGFLVERQRYLRYQYSDGYHAHLPDLTAERQYLEHPRP